MSNIHRGWGSLIDRRNPNKDKSKERFTITTERAKEVILPILLGIYHREEKTISPFLIDRDDKLFGPKCTKEVLIALAQQNGYGDEPEIAIGPTKDAIQQYFDEMPTSKETTTKKAALIWYCVYASRSFEEDKLTTMADGGDDGIRTHA